MGVTVLFRKAGGIQLIKQYWNAGVLIYAGIMSLFLGFSKKGLEILRLSIQFKVHQKLKKVYKSRLKQLCDLDYTSLPQKKSNNVWVCWLQGIEYAPLLVQRCYASLQKYLTGKNIILLTSENIHEYVSFPDYIIEKWEKGKITNTHFSDLLRLEILINHGGTWIDSTVLCTGSNIPDYIFDSDLFLYQVLKPGRDGHSLNMSSWFISSKTNNKILLVTRGLLYEYWKKKNSLVDYFLIHHFLEIVCERYVEERESIIKSCNSIPHILLLDVFKPYNEDRYQYMKEMSCFHKLSYKHDEELLSKTGTYYDVIINKGLY